MVKSFDNLIDEISYYTRLDKTKVGSFIFTDGKTYRNYYRKVIIPKKRAGEFRALYVPAAEVKMVQHYLNEVYFSKLKVHSCATAYIRGKCISDNAKAHVGNNSFLFLDVKDFFNSIDFDLLYSIILSQKENVLNPSDLRDALLLCSYRKEFVQGCVTSPVLSNIYMYDFDERIYQLVKGLKNGVYTRYSDDITISSSEKIPSHLVEDIEKLLAELKLKLNRKKCHFSSYLDNVIITGVRIKKDCSVSLNTKFKKNLKNKIYHVLAKEKPEYEEVERLLGLLSYLKMIDTNYYNIINIKYSDKMVLTVDRLKQLLR